MTGMSNSNQSIPSIKSFPSPGASLPFTLIIYVRSFNLDMLVIDMIDKVVHVEELAVTVDPSTLVEWCSGGRVFLFTGI